MDFSWESLEARAWIVGLGVAGVVAVAGLMMRAMRRGPAAPEALAPPLSSDPFSPAHDPFTDGAAGETRAAARRRGSTVAVDLMVTGENARTYNGSVLDRSVGGLGLESPEAIEVGTEVGVRPTGAASTVPWVWVVVRHCHQQGGSWRLGCQFVRTPPSLLLWQFG